MIWKLCSRITHNDSCTLFTSETGDDYGWRENVFMITWSSGSHAHQDLVPSHVPMYTMSSLWTWNSTPRHRSRPRSHVHHKLVVDRKQHTKTSFPPTFPCTPWARCGHETAHQDLVPAHVPMCTMSSLWTWNSTPPSPQHRPGYHPAKSRISFCVEVCLVPHRCRESRPASLWILFCVVVGLVLNRGKSRPARNVVEFVLLGGGSRAASSSWISPVTVVDLVLPRGGFRSASSTVSSRKVVDLVSHRPGSRPASSRVSSRGEAVPLLGIVSAARWGLLLEDAVSGDALTFPKWLPMCCFVSLLRVEVSKKIALI